MSRLEERFIATVVVNECAKEAYTFMKPKWLVDPDSKQAWDIIRSHYQEYHTTITWEEFKVQFPGYALGMPSECVQSLMDNMQSEYIRTHFEDIIETTEVSHEDPVKSIDETMSQLQVLRAQVDLGTGEDIAATADTAVERYGERKKNKGAVGKVWPWQPLQDSTLGAADGLYCLFYARPKNMKSWLAIYLLAFWYMRYEKNTLVINRELSKEQFQDRLVCMIAGLDYDQYRRAQLDDKDYDTFLEATEHLKANKNIIIESIYSAGAEAASEVDALCEKYGLREGDVLIIDGMYFYAGSSDWQLMGDFSKGVQRISKQRKLVTICTTQGNRKQNKEGADAGEELKLGDGPAQDCDLAIRVNLDEDNQEITLSIRAIREGRPCSFVINAQLCTNFDVKYTNNYFEEKDGSKPPPRGKPNDKKTRTASAPTANVVGIKTKTGTGKKRGVKPGKRKAA